MPEYLAPGVYIEEVDATPKPIPGVSTSTADLATASRLVAAMRPVLEQAGPEWSRFNHADPGITLIQLLAWVSEAMLDRSDAGFDERRKAVLRIVQAITQAAGVCANEGEPLKRPHYFDGQLLDAATLQLEQEYHREKDRRHNRNLHGFGIVSGLGVRVETATDTSGGRLVIEPGYAIDPCGEELAVPACVHVPLPSDGDAVFVSLRHWDHPCAQSPSRPDTIAARCIEEACLISIAGAVPARGLAIARLVRAESRWSVDVAYLPQRSRSA
jgi:hypothetical protein